MTAFPSNATDGQLYAGENGVYYVYDQKKNQWQSTTAIPKWTDQVFVRGQDNVTQQNTNESTETAIKRGLNLSVQADQLLEAALGVKSRGVWGHQGGVTAPGSTEIIVAKTKFLMQDDNNEKTQNYKDAIYFLISDEAVGTDNRVQLDVTEPGDILTVHDNGGLGGGIYEITGVETFEDYAKFTVDCHDEHAKGVAAPAELATIRVIKDHLLKDDHFDDRYLQLNAVNEVSDKFRLKGAGGTYVSASGDEMHLYHVAEATDDKHGANWGQVKSYADEVTTETFYLFKNLGDTGGLAPGKITYSTEHGGQFTIPSKPKSGPWLSNGADYFGWRPWAGQFSLAVEEEPRRWRTILMGVTGEIRYSATPSGNTFYEVKIPDAGLIVNTPDAEFDDLKCKIKVAGLF